MGQKLTKREYKLRYKTGSSRYQYLNEIMDILSSAKKAEGVEWTMEEVVNYTSDVPDNKRSLAMSKIRREVDMLMGRVAFRVNLNMHMRTKRQRTKDRMDKRLEGIELVDEFADGIKRKK